MLSLHLIRFSVTDALQHTPVGQTTNWRRGKRKNRAGLRASKDDAANLHGNQVALSACLHTSASKHDCSPDTRFDTMAASWTSTWKWGLSLRKPGGWRASHREQCTSSWVYIPIEKKFTPVSAMGSFTGANRSEHATRRNSHCTPGFLHLLVKIRVRRNKKPESRDGEPQKLLCIHHPIILTCWCPPPCQALGLLVGRCRSSLSWLGSSLAPHQSQGLPALQETF